MRNTRPTFPNSDSGCGCHSAASSATSARPCGCKNPVGRSRVVIAHSDSEESFDTPAPRLSSPLALNQRVPLPALTPPIDESPHLGGTAFRTSDGRFAWTEEDDDQEDETTSRLRRRIVKATTTEVMAAIRRYGALMGSQGPPGTAAVLSRQDASLVTVNNTPVTLATYAMANESKVKARAFVLATGTNDGTTGRWWEIEMTFRRATGGANAVQSGAAVVNGGQEGADAANFAATIVANASGGIDLQITGSANEINWVGTLLIEEQSLDCFCGYRTITKGGPMLSSSLVAGQPCTSIQRGAGYYSRYFRLSVPIGTTVTIDESSVAFDTYLYLLKGTSKYGSLLAQDDDSGPGTNSQIVYTTSASDGTDFTIDCTSYAGGAVGALTVQVT